ncbi:hypothetical protein CASFOL_008228 [Castilleja foliolosa]|uniref:DUF7054 domain-containing protein n=1 Tax=Castilleja foliolosa TaxID=1961234 RepID=A0ABD3E2C0_9LAMI
MSEKGFRRRTIPANRRSISSSRAPRTCRKIDPVKRGKLCSPSTNAGVLKWSKSEPSLWNSGDDEAALSLPRSSTDIYSSQEDLAPQSPSQRSPVYNKDAKVVVNVTVEGSPGPIRAMVKLGSNVEDTIKLVINKYKEEGRTPRLDKDAATTFELHHSCFTLDSLSKSDLIGEVGSRSFYLRKCSSDINSRTEDVSTSSNRPDALYLRLLPSLIDRKMKKFIRGTRILWKLLGCIPLTAAHESSQAHANTDEPNESQAHSETDETNIRDEPRRGQRDWQLDYVT